MHVLGRVERFGKRLQLDVRTLEAAHGADPAAFVPTLRRDADELEGSSTSSPQRSRTRTWRRS